MAYLRLVLKTKEKPLLYDSYDLLAIAEKRDFNFATAEVDDDLERCAISIDLELDVLKLYKEVLLVQLKH